MIALLLALALAQDTASVTLVAEVVPTCAREGDDCVLLHPDPAVPMTCEVDGDGCRLTSPPVAAPAIDPVPSETTPADAEPQ